MGDPASPVRAASDVGDPASGAAGAGRSELAAAAGLSLPLATAFYGVLIFGGSLHGYDWASHHWNYFDWVRISLAEYGTLPLFMNDAWITKNFLANAEAPSLGPLVWLLLWLPTDVYVELLLVVYTAAGLTGAYALARELDAAPPVAASAALVFAFGGFFVSHLSVGHHWAMGAQLLPGLVVLVGRALKGSQAALWGAAAANAFTILAGQHQPFIWQNLWLSLFVLACAVRERSPRPLLRWALVVLATAGLGALKLLPMWLEFADYDPSARVVGLPPGALFATLLGRGQEPGLALEGLAFAHGSGWWEYAFYVGPLGLALLLAGAAAGRRGAALLAIGLFFAALSVDWPRALDGVEPWRWLEGLPVWRTQRGPSRFLFLALFSATAAGAIGAGRLYARAQARWPGAAPVLGWLAALLLAVDLCAESLPWQRAALGEPLVSQDHRPKPLRIEAEDAAGAVAELREFAPNRLVYAVRAPREATLRFPFRLGEGTREWRVDGLPAHTLRGKLAVDVPPGERDVAMIYRPKGFYAGLFTSGATLLALFATLTWRRTRVRSSPR